ncbi:hypothetical protein [Kitasatospora sp. NPDC059327]|uniref:hypothetical protein n=1 Tax=Kitasatospora sp. NPDC059327 TaxID=3346803 RepID=UPI0036CE0E16
MTRYTTRPCTGQCVSQERAWGRDSDSASSLCASCDGCVCVQCGRVEVDNLLELCGQCEYYPGEEPDAPWDDEINAESEPGSRMRLAATVNQLVTATGTRTATSTPASIGSSGYTPASEPTSG